MSFYERDNIRALAAYVPGEQPTRGGFIKLNTNENPYPPAPAVLRAIRRVTGDMLRRYPPPDADAFRAVAAELHQVKPEQIVATNGGDELLRLVVTVFCQTRLASRTTGCAGLGVAEPSYSLYPVLAEIQETALVRIPLNEDWSIPVDFAERAVQTGCRLVMLVNPHAPSGRCEPLAGLRRIAQRLQQGGCVLLVDEAYVNFADEDALPLVREGLDNVLLLRSLSKGYGLAGLRFGYGIGHPDLIGAINKAKDSYPTDILAQTAAVAAIRNQTYARRTWRAVRRERERMIRELSRRGFVIPPSGSNFILATVPAAGPDAPAIYQALKARNIFVRYFNQDRLRDKLRITIGTPAQNNRLLREIDRLYKA